MHKPLALLRSRRLGPLFATQFLGAANDNLFKNALIVLVVYRLAGGGMAAPVVSTLAAASLVLPFVLFSATAGEVADRYDKAMLIRRIKIAEIVIATLASAAFVTGQVWALLSILFLLGTQATFFGPLKYAILPEHLDTDDLVTGNGVIEAGTFVAILLGTIAGGLLIGLPGGTAIVSAALVLLAVFGYLASRFIPATVAAAPGLPIRRNMAAALRDLLAAGRARRDVHLSILAISWFWLVGAVYLAEFAAIAKGTLHADNRVVTLFLALFSIGVGLGSLGAARLMKGEISPRILPAAALGIGLFTIDFALAVPGAALAGPGLGGISAFLAHWQGWRIVGDLLGASICGGFYTVPLYAMIQARAPEDMRARAIAANNVYNAVFMVAGSVATIGLLAAGLSLTGVFVALGAATIAVAGMAVLAFLSVPVGRRLLAGLLRLVYGIQVRGGENLVAVDGGALIVANHVSLLDGLLLAAFLPGRPTYVVDTEVADWWWVAPFLRFVDVLRVDPTSPMAVRAMVRRVEEGRKVVIFPEGRITVTGGLMKLYNGPGLILDRTGAPVVPVHIAGAERTPFSYMGGKIRRRPFPALTLTIGPPRRLEGLGMVRGRQRRQAAGRWLYDRMIDMAMAAADLDRTLPDALWDAAACHGAGRPVLEDMDRRPLSLRQILIAALVLGRHLARSTAPGESVGIMLPNAAGTAITMLALQMFGRVPALLNYTAGVSALTASCHTAGIKTVLTSARFIEAARLERVRDALSETVTIIDLQSLRRDLGVFDRMRGLIRYLAGRRRFRRRPMADPDRPAVILFTSGSEGVPKGVVLSHRNVLANCHQVASIVDLTAADTVFAPLPLFHAFGLLGGLLLPLLWGVRSILYPNALHYRRVPEQVYGSGATILFATDTFLAGYGRFAHPLDFRSLRHVFAGGERVRDETRRLWGEKFGLRLLEGYGVTEAAPVVAVNTPHYYKSGTVGRLLPGVETRLETVPGIDQGGRLWVRGPNVMLGYLDAGRPGDWTAPAEGWFDTGDIARLDEDGFVTIVGRVRRFAKIAGEMVSLGAVEEAVAARWPDGLHAVVAAPDPRKGERLLLATTATGIDRIGLAAALSARGLPDLARPQTVLARSSLPLLATGKVDYVALEREISALLATESGM